MDTFLYHESQTLTHIINNYCLHATPLYGQTSFLQHALSLTEYLTNENLTDMAGLQAIKGSVLFCLADCRRIIRTLWLVIPLVSVLTSVPLY